MQAAHDLTLAYTHHDPFFEAPTIWKTLPQPDLDKDWRFHVYVKRFELEERAGRQIRRPSDGYSASTYRRSPKNCRIKSPPPERIATPFISFFSTILPAFNRAIKSDSGLPTWLKSRWMEVKETGEASRRP
jgi:hypothetical protein